MDGKLKSSLEWPYFCHWEYIMAAQLEMAGVCEQ